MMRHATIFAWELPLEAGVVLRDRRLKTRGGLLVRLTENGQEGWGEISPLPGFSTETLAGAQEAAIGWLQAWCAGITPAGSALPSVAFGVSCAVAELAGQLPEKGNYHSALLCKGDPDTLFEQLQQQASPLAKMKVGLYEPARDGIMVNLLLEALPDLTLRLDANRGWSLEKALNFARFVSVGLRPRIAFLEETCRSQQDSRLFARETGIAIGWDESTREPGFQPRAEPNLSTLVLKPTLIGSLTRIQELIAQAHKAGLAVVISSSLESSLGLSQLARLAHWLTPGMTPGLDTLDLMQHQLVRSWPQSTLPLIKAEKLTILWSQ